MHIRPEEVADHIAVHEINERAFNTPAEANLVDILRKVAHPVISLVAEDQGEIVGHILFTPVTLARHTDLKIFGLAPMAVTPEHQGEGIGSALVREGLERCKTYGYGAVVVLGHPWFYPRFGFVPSVHYGIGCEYEVPQDAFMILELLPNYLEGVQGIILYHPAFKDI